jgi:phosphatidylserine/phosphatidylglycerophosphate/cardiolipin synthase-like enzyme
VKKLALFLALLACRDAPPPEAGDAAASSASAPSASTGIAVNAAPIVVSPGSEWSVHFSPNGGCENAVATFIASAKSSVHLMAYGFTSEAIANALIKKKIELGDAGSVEVVLDKSDKTAKGSMAFLLRSGNVKVWIDSKHQIMHDKTVVVDGAWIETGSFNFTNAAEHSNAENCLIEHDPEKAKAYGENWSLHRDHSDRLPYD